MLERVIEEINASPYGLTTSVWTRDRRGGERVAARIDSGVVTINEHMITPGMPEAPWLGRKQSGVGFTLSRHSLRSFSKMKYVYHDHGVVRFKFWRYPHDGDKAQWLRLFLRSEFAPTWLGRAAAKTMALPRLLFGKNRDYGSS